MVSPELVEEHDLNIADGPLCQCQVHLQIKHSLTDIIMQVNGTYQTSGQSCDNLMLHLDLMWIVHPMMELIIMLSHGDGILFIL